MPGIRRLLTLASCGALALLTACASPRVALPSGDASPFPDAAAAYDAAVRGCRAVQTMAARLDLSGRAGGQGLRGQVDAGFEAPDRIRLEMRAPMGRPVFILVASGADATLYLPRDDRVLRDATTADIVEALVGLRLEAAELRAAISGCGLEIAPPGDGREYAGGWVAVSAGTSTAYLREEEGRWRMVAATRPPLSVHYSAFTLSRPSTVRLQAPEPARADVTVRLTDVSVNVPLAPGVFEIAVPESAEPLTIGELRRAGPLGVR